MKYIVFGTGKKSEEVVAFLGIENIRYFVDNDSKRWTEVIKGKRIFPPLNLLKEDKFNLTIVIATSWYEDVSLYLKKMGFVERIHFFNVEDLIMIEKFSDVSLGNNIQFIGVRTIEIGTGSCIGDNVWINDCIRDGISRIKIGKSVLVGRQSVISSSGMLEVGDYCVLAPRVYISNADHGYMDLETPILEQEVSKGKETVIEENCWLGINSVISGDVIIHRGSVVGANSFVNKDVPAFSVVVGNPAKIVKMYNPLNNIWEKVESDKDVEKILELRKQNILPTREQYKEILTINSKERIISKVLAGKNMHL